MNTTEELLETTVVDRVKNHVIGMIAIKGMKRGAMLPSYRTKSSELDVACTTVKLAMDELAVQGVVRRQRARGCYVNRELSRQGRPLKTLGIVHQASHSHLFTAPFLQQIMQGIGAGHARFDMNIFTMREDGFVTAAQLADRHVDGVILLGVENHDFLHQCAEWDLPCVVADTCAEDIALDFVACDNAACAQAAVTHVIAKGHRHIRYLGGNPRQKIMIGGNPGRPMEIVQTDSIERREAAAREAARHPGVRFDEVTGLLRDVVTRWRSESDRPTVLMVDSDFDAGDLIQELAKHGISVPSDVSVCAVAGCGTAMAEGGRIAQGMCDFRGMGRKAVELLRQRCEQPGDAADPAVYRVGFEWVEGGSTREARA
jgi:DNA-binding LacI/PurR family transcriptional regulator